MSRLHKPKAGFWIRLAVAVLYPVGGLLFRIRWRHLDRMPAEGGVIVAMNHLSHIDTILMARLVWQTGRLPRFMIKSTVFDLPGVGRLMLGAKQIPVHRGSSEAVQSLQDAVDALDQGEAVVIYPEGTITKDPDHWPMQAKTGLARLVMRAPNVPVVPIGQWGAQKQKGGLFRRRTAQASVGEPLDMSKYAGAEVTLSVLREITQTIMVAVRDEVAELRGEVPPQEFYRPSRKAKSA
ncbi:MAG: lysophospholipid acyltransferase family protein [Actinomycetota bacterium]